MHKDYVFLNKLSKNMYTNQKKKGNIKNIKKYYCNTNNSLDWFNYLLYTEVYPTSFKTWVFLSVYELDVKLDKKILSLCYDQIDINNYKNTNFMNIYRYCKYKARLENKLNKVENDSWVKYKSHVQLYGDLKGYDTNFGIEGLRASKNILQNNEIEIYYLDNKPVILLVYNKYTIVNVKINSDITLLKDVLLNKIKGFVNFEIYNKQIINSVLLEEIYKKYQYNLYLTREDLVFLYEIDFPMNLLVSSNKKEKILKSRNIVEDMSIIFECNINKVGNDKKDLKRKISVYIGNIDECIENYPKYVIGNVVVKNKNIILPYYIKGNVIFNNITIKDYVLPSIVMGNIEMENALSLSNIMFSRKVLGNIYIDNVMYLENITFPHSVNDIYLESLQTSKQVKYPEICNHIYLNEKINDDINYNKIMVFN